MPYPPQTTVPSAETTTWRSGAQVSGVGRLSPLSAASLDQASLLSVVRLCPRRGATSSSRTPMYGQERLDPAGVTEKV